MIMKVKTYLKFKKSRLNMLVVTYANICVIYL